MRDAHLDLAEPPRPATVNVGVHGVRARTETYRLPELWQLHLYDYAATLLLDGVEHAVAPGTVSLTPPGTTSEMRYRGRSEHLYAHFRAPSADRPCGIGLVSSSGTDLPVLRTLMVSAVQHARTRPERSRADLWMVLLRLSERAGPAGAVPGPDHVSAAMSWIETRLAEPITVPRVAAAVGVSHNHLTRLFRQRTGGSVVGYVRRRRVEVAQHLLGSSTLSVASVAATVGFSDLQSLNKACRAELGLSPRQLRDARPGEG
ncbi:AraC family transcriptional regulator [Auraticoccus monumenti]|uniref:AraC family transcriptional regulator n=1 Tax=Auraticoccus monumenti TaxID=675864 RepID=UPI000B856165|nr:AraC family transcriptional regulator [Auraticoccus monumenti]